jgi:hypothetical protein
MTSHNAFDISRNRTKIYQDAAMISASIDRGHSNHVITPITTRLALAGFLHAALQMSSPFSDPLSLASPQGAIIDTNVALECCTGAILGRNPGVR